jgi:transposase
MQPTHTAQRPKDVAVESLRVLQGIRAHAVQEKRGVLQLLQMVIISAPDDLRDLVRDLTRMQLIRLLAAWRLDVVNTTDPVTARRVSLRSSDRRYLESTDEIVDLDEPINPIVKALAPQLLERVGDRSRRPAACRAGDNSDRVKSEAAFAMLCGVASLPASSDMTLMPQT